MTRTKQDHLVARLEIMHFGVVAANAAAISLERIGRFEEAEEFRRKADRRLVRQGKLGNALFYPRMERE